MCYGGVQKKKVVVWAWCYGGVQKKVAVRGKYGDIKIIVNNKI